MEHVRVLGDVADDVLQRLQRHVAYVVAADADGAGLDVVEPGDEVGDGRLARAGRPDERDHLAGLGGEGDLVEHLAGVARLGAGDGLQRGQRDLVGAGVGEGDVVELEPRRGGAAAPTASGFSWISDGRSSTSKTRSKLTSAVITSMRTLERPWSGPSSRVQQHAEGDDGADGQVAADREPAADAVDERGRQRRHERHRGEEDAGQQRDPDAEVADHRGLLGVGDVLGLAAAEELEQHRAADVEALGHRVAEVGVAVHLRAGEVGEPGADAAARRAAGSGRARGTAP